MNQVPDLPAVPRRVLGKTGLSIPVIPFGTQGFGNHFGFVADEDAVALVKHAVALGVNHFDCARCYGDSLRKLGLALREIPRGDVIVTGRLCCHSGASWGGYGDGEPDFSAERVVRDVEDQLAVLGTDHFDGMLIHDPPRMEPTLAKDGTLAGLLSLKVRGLVRNVGYGMRPHEFHRQAIATGDVDFLLCFSDYHLLRQSAADGVLPAAAAAGVGVMNGWSILRGLLTGGDPAETAQARQLPQRRGHRRGRRTLAVVPRARHRPAAACPAVLPARAAHSRQPDRQPQRRPTGAEHPRRRHPARRLDLDRLRGGIPRPSDPPRA